MNLCVIPARGGSKRIPRKNIRPFAGKPIIAYAIQAAQKSGLFTKIIISTDNEEIAKVSQDFGAEVPFLRPPELADDYTPTVPVIAHAIKNLESNGMRFQYVCCIYPCVPFLKIEDLQITLSILQSEKINYSFPVSEYPSPIQRALKMDQKGLVEPFYPEFETTRTQDLNPAYQDAGQFYWGRRETWLSTTKIHTGSFGFKISKWRAIDIDNNEDWLRAEKIQNAIT